MSVAELETTPLFFSLQTRLAALPPGSIDQLIARASARCDNFTKRRLGASGSTTLLASVMAGSTTISVTSTLGWDDRDEQAVLIGTGADQELIPLAPGGIALTSMISPYPGTMTLAQPLANAHTIGEPVVGYFQELSTLSHASNEDPFQEAYTQEAQLAQMHAPALAQGMDLTRLIFMKAYPLQSIYSVYYTYSYDTIYYQLPTSAIVTMNPYGWLRVRLGTVLTPGGNVKVTYQGGYATIPDEIKRAVLSYIKDEAKDLIDPWGTVNQTLGKQSRNFRTTGKSGAGTISVAVADAEHELARYVRKV
jgi:hypothetical protein